MKTGTAAMVSMLLIFCLIVFFSDISRAAAPQQDKSSTIEELQKRIQELEKEVAELQQKLKELQFRRVLPVPNPQILPGPRIPPDARQHEFNGLKYWVIPLQTAGK